MYGIVAVCSSTVGICLSEKSAEATQTYHATDGISQGMSHILNKQRLLIDFEVIEGKSIMTASCIMLIL
jgi:hypothetical protein